MKLRRDHQTAIPPPDRRSKSHVWHYFDRIGDTAKCRVCRHEIKTQKYNSTSPMIWHLENVHAIQDRGMFVSDMTSIPTLSKWSGNMGSCMRNRVFQSFEQDGGGSWRCKSCTYACQDRKLLKMFHHLRTAHWKANGPATSNEFPAENRTDNGFEMPNADERKTGDDLRSIHPFLDRNLNNVSAQIGDADPQADDRFMTSTLVADKAMLNGPYRIKINLPDGNEVEGFVVGGEDGSKNAEEDDIGSKENELASNLPRDVEQFEKDDVNDSLLVPVDHEKKFEKTGLGRSRTPRNFTRNRDERIKLDDAGSPPETEIQVPPHSIQCLNSDVKYDGNGQTSQLYEYVTMEKVGKQQNVALITLNRSKAQNALCKKLVEELNDAVTKCDSDDTIGAIIITGSETAFATGTDINEMQNLTYAQTIKEDDPISWESISKAFKPVIAAVNGYALGSGCELAMVCDIIYAGEKARFGQPEIVMGTIPGAGGGQRLTRAVGKSKAMEMMLTGNQISAVEAERSGLISKIFPPENLLSEAIKLGERISTHSKLIVSMAKEAVNSAYETTLQAGLNFERKVRSGTFATADWKEGTMAFIEKRVPEFKNE